MARNIAASIFLGALGFLGGAFAATALAIHANVHLPNDGASFIAIIMAVGGAAAGVFAASYIPEKRP